MVFAVQYSSGEGGGSGTGISHYKGAYNKPAAVHEVIMAY